MNAEQMNGIIEEFNNQIFKLRQEYKGYIDLKIEFPVHLKTLLIHCLSIQYCTVITDIEYWPRFPSVKVEFKYSPFTGFVIQRENSNDNFRIEFCPPIKI